MAGIGAHHRSSVSQPQGRVEAAAVKDKRPSIFGRIVLALPKFSSSSGDGAQMREKDLSSRRASVDSSASSSSSLRRSSDSKSSERSQTPTSEEPRERGRGVAVGSSAPKPWQDAFTNISAYLYGLRNKLDLKSMLRANSIEGRELKAELERLSPRFAISMGKEIIKTYRLEAARVRAETKVGASPSETALQDKRAMLVAIQTVFARSPGNYLSTDALGFLRDVNAEAEKYVAGGRINVTRDQLVLRGVAAALQAEDAARTFNDDADQTFKVDANMLKELSRLLTAAANGMLKPDKLIQPATQPDFYKVVAGGSWELNELGTKAANDLAPYVSAATTALSAFVDNAAGPAPPLRLLA